MQSSQLRTVYGNFPASLNMSNLSDICVSKNGVQTGPFGSQLHQKDYVEAGVPIITVEHLGDNKIVHVDTPFVSDDDYNRLIKYNLKKGDIVFSRVGSVDRRALVGEDEDGWLFSGRCLRVRPNNEIVDSAYLSYFFGLNVFKKYVRSIAVGATMPSINTKILSDLPVVYPPLLTQKKIAHILSTLDDKIELNRKMNETLEAMAQAMFKSWFVDFDPVHAKADCKSDAELEKAAAELGISKEVLALFPSTFVESEMGMIPEGWEVKKFGELLSKTIGGDWGKEDPDDKHTEKVKIIRGTDIPKIKNISIEAVPTRYVEAKKLKTRELFDGDIVIEISGGTKNQPTGRTLYVTNEVLEMLGKKVEPASFCRLFRPVNSEVGLLLSQHMLYIYDQGKTWQYQNQSTGISNFQTTIFLEKELVVIPNIKILDTFYGIVRPLIEKSLSSENITLQKTRDTLLPKLLSGELDVSNIPLEKES